MNFLGRKSTNSDDVPYAEEHPFEHRKAEAERILAKYPDRIPCIVERAKKSTLPPLMKKKFLLPDDLTVNQFVYVIRKRIKLDDTKALFIFVNNILPKSTTLMRELYNQYKSEDGYLTIWISEENTFGEW